MDYNVICGMYQMSPDRVADSVTAYHITRRENLDAIQRDGLKAQGCTATRYGDPRTRAVYLFAARQDAYDKRLRSYLFGDQTDLVAIKVRIPRSHYHLMHEDGLFNASAICADGSYPFGIQYRDDIPAGWVIN